MEKGDKAYMEVQEAINFLDDTKRLLKAYRDTGSTPEEITQLKARLKYQEALTDTWESFAQSGSDLAHKYRDLLLTARKELSAYRDAEEQGLLIKLPCKVGDTIYEVSEGDIEEYSISSVAGVNFRVKTEHNYMPCLCEFNSKSIDNSIFLTREAAEEALKGGGVE